jgi:hypothetical protein
MKPSNELFDLIKSLTKSEKRFFKLSSALQSGDKNYLKIFDAIEKQKEYNEDELKQQFKNETFIKHLPSEKNHLYKLILKSLRNYYAESSISSILRTEIKNIEILLKKGLYKEADKFLQRTKKLAVENEKFYYLFELINLEKQLLEEHYESGDFEKDLNQLIKEENEVLEKLRNLAEYHIIYSKINYVFRKEGFAHNKEERKTVNEIENYHLIKGKNTALSYRASSICYYIKGLCAATNRNYNEALKNFLKVKDILDSHPHLRSDLAKRYLRTLNHLLYCYIDAADFQSAEQLINNILSLKNYNGFDTLEIEIKIFTITHIGLLQINNKMGLFNKSITLQSSIIQNLEKYNTRINKEQLLLFYYHFAYANFGAGNYKEALHWINIIINDTEQTLRHDIFNFTRLLNLLTHFEIGNNDLLEYTIKATIRYYSKKQKDYFAETVLLKYLKKLIKFNNEADRQIIYKNLKDELEKLFENPLEKVVLDYFNATAWLESKISKKSFSDVVKNKIKIAQHI